MALRVVKLLGPPLEVALVLVLRLVVNLASGTRMANQCGHTGGLPCRCGSVSAILVVCSVLLYRRLVCWVS